METRKIGSLDVSVVGIGCNNFGWRIDAAGTAAVVDAALDSGINFFDSANMYGGGQSEEFLGADDLCATGRRPIDAFERPLEVVARIRVAVHLHQPESDLRSLRAIGMVSHGA